MLAQRRYPKEEFVRRGNEIYDRDIRAQVEDGPDNQGKIVLIDIESGAWEMDADEIAAARMDARRPDAQVWMVRVGSPFVRRFGAGWGR